MPNKILVICNTCQYGGGEIFIRQLIKELYLDVEFTVISGSQQLLKEVENYAKQTIYTHHTSGFLKLVRTYMRALGEFENIIVNGIPEGAVLSLLFRTKRAIYIGHSNEMWAVGGGGKNIIKRFLFRWLCRHGSAYVGVSKLAAKNLGCVFASDRVFYIPNATSLEEPILQHEDSSFEDSDYVYGFIGRLVSEKNLIFLLKYFSKPEMRDKNLIIAGEGELEKYYRCEYSEYANIKFIGFVEATSFYRKIDALILPSFLETCPLVILEAFSLGRIVLASNVGGIPDLIEDGVNGFLFDPYSEKSLADCFKRFSVSNRANIREAAYSRLEIDFSYHAHINSYRNLINAVFK